MRRASPWVLLLAFAMNIVIVVVVVLFATHGIDELAVAVSVIAVLLVAYLVGRRARIRLPFRHDASRHRNDSTGQSGRT